MTAKALALTTLLAGTTLVHAQKMDVKTGLWEVTSTTQMGGMLPVDTSKMTPQMRANIEAAMRAEQAKGAVPDTTRTCITPEKLEKPFEGLNEKEMMCKRTTISSSSTSQDIKIECTGKGKMSGEMKFTAQSRESVKGTIKMSASDAGNTMTVNSNMSAKWLGPSCGDVNK